MDTIIFIERGAVASVLVTQYSVKVPSGMQEEDLARPVIEVRDFFSQTTVFEIYTFGEQIVVVPVQKGQERGSFFKLAEDRIVQEIRRITGSGRVVVKMVGENRVLVQVDEAIISRLIGKKGATISELEKRLGVRIEVEPLEESQEEQRQEAYTEIKNKIIYLTVGEPNMDVRFYVDNILVLQAKSSNKGIVRIKIASDTGAALYNYIKQGKKIYFTPARK